MKRILLADDDEGLLTLVVATLGSDSRCDILLARNGDEALDIARREKPDLLLLDIVMPRRNGYEVCRELKEDSDTTGITIVMLTALVQQESLRLATDAGADDYWAKPFSPIALQKKVKEVLNLE